MAFSTYGPDPTLYTTIQDYGKQMIDGMVRNGSINQQIAAYLIQQVFTNQQFIANTICQAAQQNGVPIGHSIINDTLQKWIENLYQNYMSQASAMRPVQGYGVYQQQPVMGGYGYSNPALPPYYQQQPVPTVYQNQGYGVQQPNAYPAVVGNNGYAQPPMQSATQTANANRFSSVPRTPAPTPNNTSTSAIDSNISYDPPTLMGDVQEIKTASFKGNKAMFRLEHNKYLTALYCWLDRKCVSAEEVFSRIKEHLRDQYFAHVFTSKAVVIDAPRSEVLALIAKYEPMLKAKSISVGTSPAAIQELFTKFYMEFVQEKSETAKAVTKYIVNEFNEFVSSKYLLPDKGGYLRIDSLEDIVELYSKNTKNKCIKEWQEKNGFFSALSNIVKYAVFDFFLQTDGYELLAFGDDEDREVICKLFQDETVGGLSVNNALYYYKKGVDTKHIDNADQIRALFNSLMEKTVIAVPRYYIFTNSNPSYWITGDYSQPHLSRSFTKPSNNLEFLLMQSDQTLNKGIMPHVNEIHLEYGSVNYKLTYGISTESHYVVSMRQ